ncbi:30S ribosomal protein S1 [Granulicella tundricola]|uniref:Small ribosomal subunit protein bS1 n=1 Tax=Granulicella tundricola (strain ATCC BAA-1859 / DSM 23138 / MP5ACTX9) TaxID=1198114 RepID=E8X5J1_GRATM|nr:30S ribosomal protein S1 [Granulicella tundricola]ADW70618.1 ribosomal protein S1 [Granulicella tundricola MP5ACTX9]
MVDDHNPELIESKPLNTEIETLAPEATAENTSMSSDSTPTETTQIPTTPSENPASGQIAPSLSASTSDTEEEAGEVDYDDSDFAAALASFDREQAVDAAAAQNLTAEEVIVTGTLVKITDKHAIIDIGLKAEGLLALDQVNNPDGTPKFAVGDQIEVVVEREETHGGGYIVSHEKALRHKVWDVLEAAANSKTPVKGMVVSRVKGGLTVDIGIKAFLPGSQIEVRPVRNLDGYVGTEIEVRVIKLNKKRGNVVISRKELLEEDQNAKKAVTLATLEEGSVLTGTVKNLTDYGAFVDLGGLDGLLHITDMSWGRLTHPRDLVNVGDEIQVKVLKFDKDKQRVSLGFKQLTPDPWLDATERYPIGAQVRGRVLSVTDYGAFVELEQGIEGLVHVSEMTWSKRMKHPSKLVKPGDEVDTIILSVNPNDRRISLGMKQLQDNPWEALEDKYPTGAIIEGRVRNLTDFGAFIEIEDGIDGLVHVSNLSWTKRIKHPSEVLKKGEKVRAIVLGVEPENRRLSLGVKQLQPDVWDTFFAQHRIGDVIKGKVLRTAQFGAFVEIAEGVEGLCHVSEAVDATGKPVELKVDDEHEFKIVKMNQEEKKVGLSIRAVGEEASRAEVESYKEQAHQSNSGGGGKKGGQGNQGSSSSSGSSSSTTLGDLLNWKRAEREGEESND